MYGGVQINGGVYRCIGHIVLWGMYWEPTDVWGNVQGIQMYGGAQRCMGDIQMYGVYRCMGPYGHMGGMGDVQTYR